LAVYENFGLVGENSVMAHNIHATSNELQRLATAGASVAHCPCSNAALGSGLFPIRRHLEAGVHVSLGTDVGAGTGFGMLKEALQSCLLQRICSQPFAINPAAMLYLCTRAGAEALNMGAETGDFTPGKSADFVYLLPREPRELHLAALFTDAVFIQEVYSQGHAVYTRAH
jgi:guanine deaminase